MNSRLARLGDQQAIRDVLSRYWRGIDRGDADLVRSTYHPDARDDHGYVKGSLDGFIETLEPGVWSIFDRTQHFSGHIAVELSGPDTAHAESYAEAHHVRQSGDGGDGGGGPGSDLVFGLRYVDRFERRDDEWRIADRVCTWDWHRVDEGLGMPLPDSYFRGSRDASDPVFGHPRRGGVRGAARDLVAKRACYDALMRYARGVDRCDPELVRSGYHPGAFDDHGGYQGDVDGFIPWVKEIVMDAYTCTMHKMGNVLIEVDGDQAYGETYAIAHHVDARAAEPTDLIMGVRYLDRFECRGGDWRVVHRVMSYEWERVATIGAQSFDASYAVGRRDGSDTALQPPRNARPTTAVVPDDLEATRDRAAIYDQLVAYCRAVDRCDEALLRSVYHPDAHDDHGAYQGDLEGFVEFVKTEVQARFRSTMHKLGNSFIELDGDVAHCETLAIGHHVRAEDGVDVDDLVLGIRYLDRFERRHGEWRIANRQLVFEWQRLDRLSPLDETWTPGRHDPSDPVYALR